MVRCKFECQMITEYGISYEYSLSPVYRDEVNKEFWSATPSGSFKATIVKSKGKLFEVGKKYLIDISEANE